MSLVVNRADIWPDGTSVKAYAGVVGRGAAVEAQSVGSDGTATFTSLVDGTEYVLSALGVEVRVRPGASPAPAASTWAGRVAARRAAAPTVTRGLATLAAGAGAVTVSTSAIKAASGVSLERENPAAPDAGTLRVSARVADTSFTITSTDSADTGLVRWTILTPVA